MPVIWEAMALTVTSLLEANIGCRSMNIYFVEICHILHFGIHVSIDYFFVSRWRHMAKEILSALIQAMAFHLLGANPLNKPLLF